MKPLVLVDSNILVYAINRRSPKHQLAQDFLTAYATKLAVTHQNILETIRVLTHPKFENPMPLAKAAKAVTRISEKAIIIAPDNKSYQVFLRLIEKYSPKRDIIFDCYLAATVLSAGIATIATDNLKDFRQFEELELINPFQSKGV
jgi:uncharacterized protein